MDTMKTWLLAILVVVLTVQLTSGAQEPARARQAYDRAIALEAEGNHGAALSLLWEASGLAPRDADIQNRLGEALERIGVLDAAVDAYRRALAERPEFRKASNNLILALVKSGKGPEAVARARALVAESPKDPDRYFTLGLAQSEQDVEQAIESFRRALELAPRHTLARYNLALVLRRADRLPEALAELERALAIEPRPEAHYLMGVIYWHQGELDRAVSALRAAVAAEPRYADAHETLGSVLKEKRDWAGASASLRRAIAIRPDVPASHYALGPGAAAERRRTRGPCRARRGGAAAAAGGARARSARVDVGRHPEGQRGRFDGSAEQFTPRDVGLRRVRAGSLPDRPGPATPGAEGGGARGLRAGANAQPKPRSPSGYPVAPDVRWPIRPIGYSDAIRR